MAYTRVSHSSPLNDSSATDLTTILNAHSTGLEAAETTIAGHTTSIATNATNIAAEITRATVAETARSNGKRKVGFIGDSITAGSDTYQPTGTGGVENFNSPALFAMLGSARGHWDLITNAGVGGQTSTQILSRLQSEILNLGCDIVVIFSCSMNDLTSHTVAQSVTNVTSMITQCLAAGATPILCTPTPDQPTGSTSTRLQALSQRRRAFIELGRQYNIPVVDLFTPIGNPLTGTLASTYTGSGDVHPNPTGNQAIGLAVSATLDRMLTGSTPSGVTFAVDPDDILGGVGFFASDTNSDGIANGWTRYDGSSGATFSTPTDSVLGKLQRITATSSSGPIQLAVTSVAISASHTYEISGYISKTGSVQAQVSVNASNNRKITLGSTSPDVSKGHFSVRWTPGGSSTSCTFYLVNQGGTGTVDFANIAMRDLTALGLA